MRPVLVAVAVVEGVAIVALCAVLAFRDAPIEDPVIPGAVSEPDAVPTAIESPSPDPTPKPARRPDPPRGDPVGLPAPPVGAGVLAAGGPWGHSDIVVCGAVSGPDGLPRSCQLTFTDEISARFQVTPGPLGAYAAAGFHAGRWRLSASAEGLAPHEGFLEIPPGIPVFRHDVVLEGSRSLEVRFLAPDGRPFALAVPDLPRDPFGALRLTVIATSRPILGDAPPSPHGAWHPAVASQWRPQHHGDIVTGRPARAGVDGVLLLSADLPLHVAAVVNHVVLDAKLVPKGATSVDLRVDPAKLDASLASARIRVIDAESKEPLPKARVALDRLGLIPNGSPPGPDGTIVFRRLPPGFAKLQIWEPGYQRVEETVVLEPGREQDLGTLELARETSIEGQVTDAAGDRVRCQVRCLPLAPLLAGYPFPSPRGGETFADGSFTILRTGRSRHLITATDVETGCRAETEVDTTSGPVRDVELRLAAASKVALDFEVAPPGGFSAVLVDPLGRPHWSMFIDRSRRHDLVLAPGHHRLDLLRGRALIRSLPIEAGTAPVFVPVTIGQ